MATDKPHINQGDVFYVTDDNKNIVGYVHFVKSGIWRAARPHADFTRTFNTRYGGEQWLRSQTKKG